MYCFFIDFNSVQDWVCVQLIKYGFSTYIFVFFFFIINVTKKNAFTLDGIKKEHFIEYRW